MWNVQPWLTSSVISAGFDRVGFAKPLVAAMRQGLHDQVSDGSQIVVISDPTTTVT